MTLSLYDIIPNKYGFPRKQYEFAAPDVSKNENDNNKAKKILHSIYNRLNGEIANDSIWNEVKQHFDAMNKSHNVARIKEYDQNKNDAMNKSNPLNNKQRVLINSSSLRQNVSNKKNLPKAKSRNATIDIIDGEERIYVNGGYGYYTRDKLGNFTIMHYTER
jgi:hypothetical protein